MRWIVSAWGRILTGLAPSMSIEITRECPLRCPGCYAYGEQHLGGGITLREVRDFRGQALIDGVLRLVDAHRPLHVSLVGGEPLVRYRELGVLLPRLSARGVHVQVVTSAVRPIPEAWAAIPRLSISVSVDGLQPEHDARRAPATYDRILRHIEGHQVTIHCTITRQQVSRAGYIEAFLRFWSSRAEVRRIWISLYTPQVGEMSDERLTAEDRARAVTELMALRAQFPKLEAPRALLEVYARPPVSPQQCTFAQTTTTVSADLETRITPCQFGGTPDCASCGCVASAGLEAIARHRLLGMVPVGAIFRGSTMVGARVGARRRARAAGAVARDRVAARSPDTTVG